MGRDMKQHSLKLGLAIVAGMGLSTVGHAEEASQEAASPTAAVNHDFSVTVPEFLFFQVGSAGATIDLMDFAPTAANAGSGTDIAGTGGNASAGAAATAEVRSNAGQVTITPSNNSAGAGLTNVAANAIAYSEITPTSDSADLANPVLSNAGGTPTTPTLSGGDTTDRTATWTFVYSNTNVVEAGTYGTSARGGRVTYTASTP